MSTRYLSLRYVLPVAAALVLVSALVLPSVTLAAAPTGSTATVTNSTATTVDVVVTGTSFNAFVNASSSTANATDLAKIQYRGTTSTAATVTNATTLTLTFPISIGTDKSGSLTIAAGAVMDGGGNQNLLITIANGSITDTAQPQYISSQTLDNNNDGTVDFIKVVYSEPIASTSVAAADYAAGIANTTAGNLIETATSGIPTSGNLTDTADDATIYVGVTSGTEIIATSTTDYLLKIQQVGAVSDLASSPNSLASFTSKTSTDGAKPIIKSVTILDAAGSNDGLIDRLVFIWSETIDTDNSAAPVAADLPTTILPDGSTAVFTSSTISDPTASTSTINVTSVAGQVTKNTGAGSTAISGDLSAKWVDGAANVPHATGATGNESIVDAAAPIVVSVTPANAANGQDRAVEPVIVFSEPMDTTSLSFASTDQVVTYSAVWSASDTTATLTHGGDRYASDSTVTSTISAANAVAGTPVTLVGLPYSWLFVVEHISSGSGGGSSHSGGGSHSSSPASPSTPSVIVTPGGNVVNLPVTLPSKNPLTLALTVGSRGVEVSALQAFLAAQGVTIYPEGLVTGYFGQLTLAAVQRFQLRYGIVATASDPGYGFVGPKTRAKINGFGQ